MAEKHEKEMVTVIPLEDKTRQGSLDSNIVTSKVAAASAVPNFKPISNFETMIHFLKGNIGTGIFSMPSAFKNSGLWVGTGLLPIFAIICTHCMQMLVKSADVMKKREGDFSVSYAGVAESVCRTGQPKFAKFGNAFATTVNVFICLTNFGACVVYVVFTGTNLFDVVENYAELGWDVRVYMCFMTIPLIFITWIRNLKLLAPVSVVAGLVQLASIIVVFYYTFSEPLPPTSSLPAFGSWSRLPLFFGTAVFAFEGIPLVLPIQKEMGRPWDFKGWTGILNTGMVLITVIYVSMGFYGYLSFGEEIQGSITQNLPSDEVLAQTVKILLIIAIFGNYAMAFYVPISIIWPPLSKYAARYTTNLLAAELMFRTFMVLVTLLLAAAIPKIDLVISLVGAVSGTFLALIFPPLLEYITYAPNISKLTLTKEILILIFGAIGFTTGTYAAILAIVQEFTD